MTLTDRQIRAAKVPQGLNQIEIRDVQVRGLLLRVYAGGARTWMLAYRRHEDNRRRQLKLGDYPGVSLKQARQLAEVEIGNVATGEDPKGERDERRAGSTAPMVAEVAKLYLTEYAQEHKRPKGYAMERWQIEAYCSPAVGPVDEVTRLDVRELLEALASGKLAARGKRRRWCPGTSRRFCRIGSVRLGVH